MSEAGQRLSPILMRSGTPGPAEKVLRYLEGMSREGDDVDISPPRSLADAEEYNATIPEMLRSPGVRSKTSQALRDLAKSPVSYDDRSKGGGVALGGDKQTRTRTVNGDDAASIEQNGQRSEFGDHPLPVRQPSFEPGPNDDPGPHYPSFDSGPSFGNFGPMPDDGPSRTPMFQPTWTSKAQQNDERPWSPMSSRSRLTKATEKATAYPALPESRVGEDDSPPRSKTHSPPPPQSPSRKAEPLSPRSATRSMQNPPRSPGGSMFSGGHQNRPFSPYRHAPTHEDLLHAAVRGRAFIPPDLDQSAAEPALPPPSTTTPVMKAASVARSQFSAQSPLPVKAPSIASHRTGSTATPIQRPYSPNELNQEEEQIVQDTLAGRTPRTSHYAPSVLGSDVVNSHFHDMDLCVLLHQENDPTVHDVVKKALRKAIRQRVKNWA
ncbi:unnamed protein product [Mycena citricolor]|uniref:Uncharacterized protein n=1 Tax=Mycena citricolor TaxID=2018698 RepID=A0AAD2GZ91_9AGAR|nr:unnamed protein product [Mycena citricolor]